ncbi:DUF1353 domain-containing protein [Pseudocolwellia agarivorans]|uniref:DUF1353 domain-containing protein n=1 Tax=Pseudocolwellia agarivorans TaxID=1911682 RepID=UPI0009859606|nr:DUF1353 domain-containing protein [Pseudocolwellia agarivorans]
MYRKLSSVSLFVLFTALAIFAVTTYAGEVEYFGEFSGEPSFKVKTNDEGRPTFILLDNFSFTDPNGFKWEVPKNWEVDGASIPKLAWSFVGGPMSGKYIHASIIHDKYCDTKKRTSHDTHRNFYYGMKANGVSEAKASVMYWAVRTFGPSWKVVKVATSHKFMGPSTYRLKTVAVSPPDISEEKMKDLLKLVRKGMPVTQLESLSDKVRNKYGAEKLQRVVPTLSVEEIGTTPKIKLPKF